MGLGRGGERSLLEALGTEGGPSSSGLGKEFGSIGAMISLLDEI